MKRIKFLLDRYIAFEATHGTEDSVRALRQKVLNLSESIEPESS